MNHEPTGTSAFSDSHATQTNPFTGDLKGDFTSDFGTSTNAMSQMFKGDNMGGGDKKRIIFLALGGLVIVALLGYLLLEGDDQSFQMEEDFAAQQDTGDKAAPADDPLKDTAKDPAAGKTPMIDESLAEKPLDKAPEKGGDKAGEKAGEKAPDKVADKAPEPAKNSLTESKPNAPSEMATTGSITISQPLDGGSLQYDETQGPSPFSWSGNADLIVFSRSASMVPVVRQVSVAGRQSYRFLHPHPGRWYWRLQNAEGGTAVHSFTIAAPIRRNFPITQPAAGGKLSGNGGVIAWQGDTKVARYQVQLIQQGGTWANPQHRFGTSGTSLALSGVAPGNYDLRVGAFSEVAGRWEWQVVPGVSIQ